MQKYKLNFLQISCYCSSHSALNFHFKICIILLTEYIILAELRHHMSQYNFKIKISQKYVGFFFSVFFFFPSNISKHDWVWLWEGHRSRVKVLAIMPFWSGVNALAIMPFWSGVDALTIMPFWSRVDALTIMPFLSRVDALTIMHFWLRVAALTIMPFCSRVDALTIMHFWLRVDSLTIMPF